MIRTSTPARAGDERLDSFVFSASEYAQRRSASMAIAEAVGADVLLSFGENRSGLGVTYLTGWPVTRLAVHRLTRDDSRMWIQFHNHLPQATRLAMDTDVRDAAGDFLDDVLSGVGAAATLGAVPAVVSAVVQERGIRLVPVDREHAALRSVKSAEERDALRAGARASDIGARALIQACVPGATDWDLLAAARSAYTRVGARDHICYIAVTDMRDPDRDVPNQSPEGRVLGHGSAITFELSASVAPEYPGQILRTVVIGAPTETYAELHDVADRVRLDMRTHVRAGTPAMTLVGASSVIEEMGLTTTDDLFHGLGMGYLEPIGTSVSRIPRHSPTGVLMDGMAVVIQPNVTTADHRAGVQTGEMVLVTVDGLEDIHDLPPGLVTVEGGA